MGVISSCLFSFSDMILSTPLCITTCITCVLADFQAKTSGECNGYMILFIYNSATLAVSKDLAELLYFLSNIKYIPIIFFILIIKFSSMLFIFYEFFGRFITFVFIQKYFLCCYFRNKKVINPAGFRQYE